MSQLTNPDHERAHRGHREALRALAEWTRFMRTARRSVVKDWGSCENVDPNRLSLGERVSRGEYGDNVVAFRQDQPSLDSLDQLPASSYTYPVKSPDVESVISDMSHAVRQYFYTPATVLTYSDFCALLEQIKMTVEAECERANAASVFERERELSHCYYSFIYAGFGKLEGDIETGVSPAESPEALQSAIMLLASIRENAANQSVSACFQQMILAAETQAQNLQARVAGLHSLPTLSRSPRAS